jgi:metallo-beta-lactamase class B
MGDRVYRLGSRYAQAPPALPFPRPRDAVTTTCAAGPGGLIVVGCAARLDGKDGEASNLFLLAPNNPRPVWARQALADLDDGPAPEPGRYGSPTLPDGTRETLPQRDVRVSAPLSIALLARPELRRVAVADYPGWQRWVRSSVTGREQNHGMRFLPARPTVTVYDSAGGIIRRFGPDRFPRAGWFDLKWLPGGRRLIAYPHHWSGRGLAGQPTLPADKDALVVYVLDVQSAGVRAIEFPDSVSDLDVGHSGELAVACWDGRVYRLNAERDASITSTAGTDVGGPALIRLSRDGTAIVATSGGVVRRLNGDGREAWRVDLSEAVPAAKSWVKARAEPIGENVWKLPGGRVESDLGGQWLVRAPHGLILIEGHAGLSFEREWAAVASTGLDPARVKYVLATHEHGDHAPGAYLWRAATGAEFVCSAEMAYGLQHHIPLGTGYGFHPPVPTDIHVTEDCTLDLAGLPVRAIRVPGHTAGSMAWMFEAGGKRYLAIGDLIMPGGVLGYDGSISFSGADVLASLRKLDAMKPDIVLPGHGPDGDPSRYLTAGIDVGVHVGWGKIRPERPDPYFRLTRKNVRVVAWNLGATSADFGDIDGDSRPDVAVVVPEGDEAAVIKLFLNRGGNFLERPDHEVRVAGVAAPTKLRVRRLNDDRIADFLVGGRSAALVLSRGDWPQYRVEPLALSDANQVRLGDPDAKGERPILVGPRFGAFQVARRLGNHFALEPLVPEIRGPYADVRLVDVNGDGRNDLVSSSGQIFPRREDGSFPGEPGFRLSPFPKDDWSFLAVGDFNADGQLDLVLLDYQEQKTQAAVYYHTAEHHTPYPAQPSSRIDLEAKTADRHPLLRDAPVVADWDGDGVDDLIVGKGQDRQILVLRGGREGLDQTRSLKIPLDYRLHYETGLFVGDFDGDRRPDIAAFGDTNTGVGAGGPPSVYLWIRADDSRN